MLTYVISQKKKNTSFYKFFLITKKVYYKEAVGCFIVFDVTRQSTFEAVSKWKNDLDTKVQLADGKPIPCLLLANKVPPF